MPEYYSPNKNKMKKTEYLEMERKAKIAADKAIKVCKNFHYLS